MTYALHLQQTLNKILVKHTGKPFAQIELDTDRDFYMSGEEAKAYGLIDHVYSTSADAPTGGTKSKGA